MAVLGLGRRKDPESKINEDLLKAINHGRENLGKTSSKRDECWEFFRGNHFAYLDARGQLQILSTGPKLASGQPNPRARQARNYIFDVVLRACSQSTQRVPSYQVVASTTDPQDVAAASLSEKVALFGYHEWGVRGATIEAVQHAVIGGEAFGWAYFDSNLGPYVGDEGDAVGTGDVRVRVFGGNSTYWVPGLKFDESPWHCVELAMEVAQVKNLEGFLGGELTPDAQGRSLSARNSDKAKLVCVTHYLERPCPKYAEGRWITLANGKRILEDRPYPGKGNQPVLRSLTYAPDADNDRSLGLVSQLLDPQRTKNDAENKAVEWKNMALFPQWVVSPGLMKKQRRSTEPNKVYEIPNPNENHKVLDPPPIPDSLFAMADRAENDLFRIAGQSDPPAGADSGKAYQVWIEKNAARDALFVASLADWHANLMHDCLAQVAENYTEPRLLTINGDFAWEPIEDFKGAQLRDQIDVRVFADSIEPQTRQAKEQKVMNYFQMGAVSAEQAMTAIETGATEGLIQSSSHSVARVGRIIQRLKQGPQALAQMPTLPTGRLQKIPQVDPMTGQPAVDPMTGQPVMVDSDQPEMAPGWMPRYSDNLNLFRSMFEDWMSTEEYERLTPEVQGAAAQVYAGVLMLEAEKAAEAQAAQAAQAEQLGMGNAAKPQGFKPTPSLPATNGGDPAQ